MIRGLAPLLLVLTLAACVDSAAGETCIEVEITYSGMQDGRVYVKEVAEDGFGGGLGSGMNVQQALALYSASAFQGMRSCWGAGKDERYDIVAWIDLDDDEKPYCMLSSGLPDGGRPDGGWESASTKQQLAECVPDPHDPQGMVSVLIKGGESNVVRVDILDPVPL